MKTGWLQRVICFILAFVMVLGFAPVPAIAAESDGLCEHHTEHTASCGYSPAVDGHACGHEHTDECYQSVTQCVHTHGDCGYVPAVEGHGCSCQPDESGEIVHTEGCGYVEAAAEVPCNHVCSAETGCITRELNCRHEHDSDCGYVEAAQESPCTFRCEECGSTVNAESIAFLEAVSQDGIYCYHVEANTGDSISLHPIADYADTNALEYQWLRWDSEKNDYAQISLEDNSRAQSDTLDIDVSDQDFCEEPAYMCIVSAENRVGKAAFLIEKKADAQIPTAIPGAMVVAGAQASTFSTSISSASIDSAIAYAYNEMNTRPDYWKGYCAAFVWSCYRNGAGLSNSSYPTARQMGDALITNTDANPPRGAFVFWYKSSDPYGSAGHVGLSLGDGTVIHAFSSIKVSSISTVNSCGYTYRGWGAPIAGYTIGTPTNQPLTVTGADYPSGHYSSLDHYGLRGVFTSSNTIVGITAYVRYTAGKDAISFYNISWNSNTYDIRTDGVNDHFTFGVLPDGSYVYYVEARDSSGAVVSVSSEFSIGTGVCDHVSDGGTENQESTGTKVIVYECTKCGEILKTEEIPESSDITASGSCGDVGSTLIWTLYKNGQLVIEGNGKMGFYLSQPQPWADFVEQIKSVEIKNGVTVIGARAFAQCSNLTSVSIPDSVTWIGQSAFEKCTSLVSLQIPDSVKIMHPYVFQDCTSLISMELPEEMTVLSQGLFMNCSSLESVTLSNNFNTVIREPYMFKGCSSLRNLYVYEQNEHYTSIDGVLYSKDLKTIVRYPVGRTDSFVIPQNVTGIAVGCFRYAAISEVIIPESVTTIESNSFQYCGNLKNIVIPSGVTSLENSLFHNCTSLESITIPDNVSTIGDYCFSGCTALKEIWFREDSAPSCAENSFENVSSKGFYPITWTSLPENAVEALTWEVYIKDDLTGTCGASVTWRLSSGGILTISGEGEMSFGEGATAPWTQYYPYITSAIIQPGVTNIATMAFYELPNLTQVSIPETVTEIEELAFYKCPELSILDLPDSILCIGKNGLFECGLTSIQLPEGIATISNGTFFNCSQLSSVTIPASVTNIESSAFRGCSSLADVYYNSSQFDWDQIVIAEYNDCLLNAEKHFARQEIGYGACGDGLTWGLTEDGILTISGSGDMEDYNTYPPNAAPWCDLREQITSVVVCDGVAGIGEYAFFECSNLTSVTLAESVTSIGEGTFCGCESLTSITLPDSVSFIGENAFGTCRSLTSVNIPASLKSIEGGTFQNCEGLTSITIPDSVTSIGAYAFNWCKSLTSVDIPDSVTSIKNGTFEHCEGLTSITIPDSVTSIGDWAFFNCTGLTGELAMPNSLKTIGENAFESCTGLTDIALNEGLTSIGYRAFAGCTGLTGELVIPSSVETIREDAFSCCPGLTSVTLSEGLTRISDGVFSNCTGLTGELVIPNSVESIGASSFAWCANLNSVVIPASVTEIGTCAFVSCNALKKIVFGHASAHSLTIEEMAFNLEAETPLDTGVFAPNAQGMNAAITGYDWDGSNRCVSFVGMNRMDLAGTELTSQTVVWIDGEACPVQRDEYGGAYVNIPENAHTMVTYTFNDPNAADVHTQYPTGMKVWVLKQEDGAYTAEYVPQLDNLLRYSGSSIRIAGVKGIRMITSVDQNTRDALTGNGLAGFRLVEYGTLLAQTGKLGSDPLVLGGANVRSNYAYRRGVADPVFKRVDGLIQYTNVLVGFTQENCKEDIAMRPYIILEDEAGQTYTIYGGIVYRSVGYIAYQNRNAFAPGSAAYQYVWDIIHYVYGDQYDADYKG